MVYLDNGREFLSSDIGGRGRRKTDISSDYGKTPGGRRCFHV